MKGIVALILVVFSYGIWFWKRRVGAAQLAAVEKGERCLACHGDQLIRDGQHMRCLSCGHLTDLAWLNSATVSAQEIAELSRPDRLP